MANLTALQRHVLDNLERVVDLPYTMRRRPYALKRYKLDGKECSAQITGLVVRGYVREVEGGRLARVQPIGAPKPITIPTLAPLA